MKIFTQIGVPESIQTLATTTSQYIDDRMKAGYAYLLSPQWFAGYAGLKKLIEKDYSQEEEAELLSAISS